MKKLFPFALVALVLGFAIMSCDKEDEFKNDDKKTEKNDSVPSNPKDSAQTPADTVIAYTLSASLDNANSFYLSDDTTNNIGYYYRTSISIGEFEMVHGWSSWGFGGGFTYSNCADDTTASNYNMSAITKGGVNGGAYFIAYTGSEFYGLPVEITFKDGKAFNAKEVYVTNSTSAYLAIKEGKADVAVKKWEAGDWFALTITGYYNDEVTNSKIVVLANGPEDILNTWEKVDLSSLGKVQKISFSLDSSDQGDWGMNTPAYFCLDQLTVTE